MRLLKSNSLFKLTNMYLIDDSQTSNISYAWNFLRSLFLEILSAVTLAMLIIPMTLAAFEHLAMFLIPLVMAVFFLLAVIIASFLISFCWNFLCWSTRPSVPSFSKTVAPSRSSSQYLTTRYYFTSSKKARLVKAPVVQRKEQEDSKLLHPFFFNRVYWWGKVASRFLYLKITNWK